MNRQEEAQFEGVLREAIDQAKQFDYYPSRFIGMIASKGSFQTVKDIVASGKPSEGFEKLVLHGRTDLTCEAIIVETQWRQFFDDDLLLVAEHRLTRYGYKWRAFVPAPLPPSLPAPTSLPIVAAASSSDEFVPPTDDHREKVLREEYCRQGQAEFRTKLINVYGARCMVTGLTIREALEAAHICAYRGQDSNHVCNGLLLRADLHALFDRFLFSIEPDSRRVRLSARLKASETYARLDGTELEISSGPHEPSVRALRIHWNAFLSGTN
jgi:hypothetical protein